LRAEDKGINLPAAKQAVPRLKDDSQIKETKVMQEVETVSKFRVKL
jgi:hypothetical protein